MEVKQWLATRRSWLVDRKSWLAERPSWLVGLLTLGAAALASLGVVAAIALQGSQDAPSDAGRDAAPRSGFPFRSADEASTERVPLPRSLADGASTAGRGAGGAVSGDTSGAGDPGASGREGAGGGGSFGTTTERTLQVATGTAERRRRARRPARSTAAGGSTGDPGLADAGHGAGPPADTGATTTAPPPPEPPPPPPPPPPPGPLEINDVRLVESTPFTATITWETNLPGRGQVVFGTDSAIVWSESDEGTRHKITIAGLTQSTDYVFRAVSWDAWHRMEHSGTGRFRTPRLTDSPTANVRGDTILLNGQPYFPTMVWERCDVPRELLAFGIDLFMGCPADRSVAWRLGHDAYTLSPAGDPVTGGAVIGRYLPDEWDSFLPSSLSVAELTRMIPPKQGNELDFLGLTNHFYSYAAPLPHGRGMYPALMQKADVLGFNLYPLQIWCRDNAFHHVYHAQKELHTLSGGKPTFQWIEANPMENPCGHEPHLAITGQTVRAETWLAVAGGADGVGYFPHGWGRGVAAEIKRTNDQIKALAPALLSAETETASEHVGIRVGARRAHGALYVVAVNVTRERVAAAEITLPGLNGRPLAVYDENRTVDSDGDAFRDEFGPLEVHLYVVAPTA